MHDAVNAAVVEWIENGMASSCSLMVPCPAALGPGRRQGGRPSLLDPDTAELYVNTPASRTTLLAAATLADVERELRSQIDAVVDVGLAPTHLDWHCFADGGRADIFDLGMARAEEYSLAARVWLEEGRCKAHQQGKPVVDKAFLDSYSTSLHDDDDEAATYARMLRDLPPGLDEWAIHPAMGTDQWQTIEPAGWQIRQIDHELLTSPRAHRLLDHEGITVIDYRPLQRMWNS